jgi:hypothetical protein
MLTQLLNSDTKNRNKITRNYDVSHVGVCGYTSVEHFLINTFVAAK